MIRSIEDQVGAVRAFTRRWSEVARVLDAGLLESPYALTEARVLFELNQADSLDLRELRRIMDIDPSYLTRIVGRFTADGLVAAHPSTADARKRVLRLTEQGRSVARLLDERSQEQNRALLAPLEEADRERLTAAMDTVREVIDRATGRASTGPRGTFRLRALRSGDLGWVIARHATVYADEYGWDDSFEALVARVVADFAQHRLPGRDDAWIAEVDGQPVGCVFCVHTEDERVGQLRLLLVDPAGRGLGVGSALVDACVRFAREAGYQRLVLWTNDVLASARRIYRAAGFTLADQDSHRSFGHDLVGQHWELRLS
ncbi:MAG TPA: helix-turn-helix domain-containing GNAT family N-acetyltransferase [Pseudonocardiaceae bacterium]|jgi:DNA-binding MarR family transcriptional regulator/N-acetylglutamate synthase-like GNAT family acetyltransferase|nr:helix-turn-helix domain-containing GNAT family N-acetyltransferase [Pseudonocardiaceae bacterium]